MPRSSRANSRAARRPPLSDTPVLRSKLVRPNLGSDLLDRPRLLGALGEHARRALTLVVADAGYGKTTLLAAHAARLRAPVSWYGLMPSDADIVVFARHFLVGVRQHQPRFGRTFERAITENSRGATAADRLAMTFAADWSAWRGPALHLFLDDFHEMSGDSLVPAFLEALLRLRPRDLRVVIGTRTPPGLAVEPLRVRGETFELDSSHQRFTPDELRLLFDEVYRRPLGDADLAAVEHATSGWPTAVFLVHEGLRRDPARALTDVLDELRGPGVDLQEFLASEIHARLEPAERHLLERVAALQRFDAGLGAALAGVRDAGPTLRRLTRRGLLRSFGTVPEESYELHDLVRDFLRRHVESASGAGGWAALEAESARVLASRGEHERALRHHLLSGTTGEAEGLARLLAPRLLREGRAATLRRYLEDLPRDRVEADLGLHLALAECLLALSEWDAAERMLAEHMRRAEAEGQPDSACRALLGLCKVLNMRGRHEEVLGMAERGLAISDRLELELRIRLLQRKAGAHFYLGQPRAAVRILAQVQDLLPARPDPELELPSLHNFAMAFAAMGHFRDAIRHFEAALSRVRDAPTPRTPLYLSNMAFVFAEVGELAEARAAAAEGAELSRRFGNRAQEMTCRNVMAQVLAQSGDFDGALAELRVAEEMNRELRMEVITGDLLALRGRIFCERGQYRRGAEFLTRAIQRLRERDRPRQVEFLGLLAWCELRSGRPHAAREILVRTTVQADAGENDYERMRSHYWLAEARLAVGETREARDDVALALRLSRELGFGYFLSVQAREEPAPLRFALEQGIEVDGASAALAEAGPVVEDGLLEALSRARTAGSEAALAVLGEVGGRRSLEVLEALSARRPALRPALRTAIRHIEARIRRNLPDPATSPRAHVRLRIFGPPVLEIDGRPVPASAWRSQRSLQILVYLALHPGGANREQLLEVFWPGRQLAAGRRNFHPTLSYLRSVLPPGPSTLLSREGERYRLDPGYPLTCDAWDFAHHLEEARAARDDDERRRALEAAATISSAPLLDGLYGDWADEAQASHRDRLERTLVRLGELEMARGEYERALPHLRRASELDTFRENTRVSLIECLMKTGNRRAARVEYERMAALLRAELDVEPLPETRERVGFLLGALPDLEHPGTDPAEPGQLPPPQGPAGSSQVALKRSR